MVCHTVASGFGSTSSKRAQKAAITGKWASGRDWTVSVTLLEFWRDHQFGDRSFDLTRHATQFGAGVVLARDRHIPPMGGDQT